jgi:hypothetical protein
MAKFYFYVKAEGRLVSDDDGVELAGLDMAKAEAIALAREVLAETLRSELVLRVEAVLVTDQHGHPIFVMPVAQLLPGPWDKNRSAR